MSLRMFKKIVRWLLLVAILLYILTGYGISEFRVVESITFGLLSKPLAFKMHNWLIYPTAALLVLHVCLTWVLKAWRKRRSAQTG